MFQIFTGHITADVTNNIYLTFNAINIDRQTTNLRHILLSLAAI